MKLAVSCMMTGALFVVAGCASAPVAPADVDQTPETRSAAADARVEASAFGDSAYVRVNLMGYLPADSKVAVVFSDFPMSGDARLVDATSNVEVARFPLVPSTASGWGRFDHYYTIDFTDHDAEGRYRLVLPTGERSAGFRIDHAAYGDAHDVLLDFMRQQRCGYNPFLDMVCHRRDARTAYGPLPEGTFIDVYGGWHDAGDQLKYMITSSYATAHMLLAYELEPDKFADGFDALGHPNPNDTPDVLDEARWGLDWMHRMHPEPGHLYHQIADDRDHIGWKWPDKDSSDYGWGPDSYRVVYFADGEPQGLREYKSRATGVSNLAGRYAAAMATAYRIYLARGDTAYALKSLRAAEDVYRMGEENEGFQQGNSHGAPYRYTEDTWADDMEWGAAALFEATGDGRYLEDAIHYARTIGTTSWLGRDTTDHYQFYPYVNVGHFALYPHVDEAFKDTLAGYYRDGIEKAIAEAGMNPFSVGVPFIWCSNNLMTGLITQVLLYERMTGDTSYRRVATAHRDWLFGVNPWGTSMFTGLPADGEHPDDVHTSIWALTKREAPGGLVDGPVYGTIYRQLRGLTLTAPDEFAHLQNPYVVYHDDIGDYSTNEPTMDGTAGAVFLMAHYGTPATGAR